MTVTELIRLLEKFDGDAEVEMDTQSDWAHITPMRVIEQSDGAVVITSDDGEDDDED